MSRNGTIIVRAGKALAVYLIFAALLYGLAIVVTGNFDNASPSLREQYDANGVLSFLGVVKSKIVGWNITSLIQSWLIASFFLSVSQHRESKVSSDSQGRRSMSLWVALFVLALAGTGFAFWRFITVAEIAAMLLDGKFMMLAVAGFVSSGLAFWLATGLAVTITLKPAVPLAETLLPSFWNR